MTASSSFVSDEIRESCHNFRLPGKRVACYSPLRNEREREGGSFPRGSVELASRNGNRRDVYLRYGPFDPHRSPRLVPSRHLRPRSIVSRDVASYFVRGQERRQAFSLFPATGVPPAPGPAPASFDAGFASFS